MILYTKEQIAEISYRPLMINEIFAKVAKKEKKILLKKTNRSFVIKMRKRTNLNICVFSPELYYIKYN